MVYAKGTEVPVEKSRAEIEKLVRKFGAEKFGSMLEEHHATIVFASKGRGIRFLLPLPEWRDKKFLYDGRGSFRSESAKKAACEAEHRRLWRALALVIKAKLEAVDSGITTFEHEFLAHFVSPNGQTVGDMIIPQLAEVTAGTANPMRLLGGGGVA